MNSIRRLASVRLRLPGSLLILSGLLICAMMLLSAAPAHAQQLTGTLSATVYDTTGAVVPNAAVILKNSASGDVRRTVSNGEGYFTFTAVQPGDYTISISAQGFTTWSLSGITMHLGDTRTVPNIALKPGAATTTVEVVADKNVEVPLDTPEVSTTMNAEQIEDMSLGGRDAGELLKMMPGAAFTNGMSQGSGFNPKVTGTNSGPVGNYSLNGTQPYGAMAYMLDGANLIDPGNAGTQIANINEDMVSEVKVLTGSYDASYAYGPVIFEAFSKSGGKNFHGEGYLYARNSELNSWESFTKEEYRSNVGSAVDTPTAQALSAKLFPYEYFYYIGGNVGGPVVFPHFNHNRNKLFFWGGYEYMIQHPNQAAVNYNVITNDQRNGQFDKTPEAGNNDSAYTYAFNTPSGLPANTMTDASGNTIIPTSDYDPDILGVLKLYPTPNVNPNGNNGYSNYTYAPSIPQNRWEGTGKLDWAISDNTKLSGTYAYQSETDQHPIAVWWAPAQTLPYPALPSAHEVAYVILTNFTHQFNPTTTNEAVFTLSHFINPLTISGTAANRSTVGMGSVPGLFGHTSKLMPNIWDNWSSGLSTFIQEPFAGFSGAGFGKMARVPQVYDTVSKVIGSHTAKAGFYWDQPFNSQSSGGNCCNPGTSPDQGQFNIGWPANYGTGNIVSDFLLGRVASYSQPSASPIDNAKYAQWSIWAQDSWKATRQLTLNLGLRLDHVGQWYGSQFGNQVWVPSSYVDSPTAPKDTGLQWHAVNSAIPMSGFVSPLFYPNPRIGLIYDLFGTGKTVMRAGFGSYHYQGSTNEATGSISDGPTGVYTYNTPNAFQGYRNILQGIPGGAPPTTSQENSWLGGNNVTALLQGDNRTPVTLDWNVSIDQAIKWQSLIEISYVGNHTTGEAFNGTNGNINNLDNIPLGGLWAKDPITGNYTSPNAPGCDKYNPDGTLQSATSIPCWAGGKYYAQAYQQNDFRPLHQYGNVYLVTHQSYEKYNSLQASWKKNGARLNFQANYTFSKVMGIWDGDTSNGSGNGVTVWPYAIAPNYGPLDYDHTHIFNIWYIYNLPSPIHGNRLLGTMVNDWKLSGWNTYQSGAFLQSADSSGGPLNVVWPSVSGADANGKTNVLFTMPNGLDATSMNVSTWMGTPSLGNQLMPLLTCNPAKNLHSGQHFNPNCFQAPTTIGQEGPLHWPYMRFPGYLDNDLSIFKSFPTTESQRIEVRIQAQNFVNHPNPQFGLASGNLDNQLSFKTIGGFNTNSTTTGKPQFTTGQRLMTFSGKYYF